MAAKKYRVRWSDVQRQRIDEGLIDPAVHVFRIADKRYHDGEIYAGTAKEIKELRARGWLEEVD